MSSIQFFNNNDYDKYHNFLTLQEGVHTHSVKIIVINKKVLSTPLRRKDYENSHKHYEMIFYLFRKMITDPETVRWNEAKEVIRSVFLSPVYSNGSAPRIITSNWCLRYCTDYLLF